MKQKLIKKFRRPPLNPPTLRISRPVGSMNLQTVQAFVLDSLRAKPFATTATIPFQQSVLSPRPSVKLLLLVNCLPSDRNLFVPLQEGLQQSLACSVLSLDVPKGNLFSKFLQDRPNKVPFLFLNARKFVFDKNPANGVLSNDVFVPLVPGSFAKLKSFFVKAFGAACFFDPPPPAKTVDDTLVKAYLLENAKEPDPVLLSFLHSFQRRVAALRPLLFDSEDVFTKPVLVSLLHYKDALANSGAFKTLFVAAETEKGWVDTSSRLNEAAARVLFVDCEMVATPFGSELARITVVDGQARVVLESLVRPRGRVVDFRTKYSGLNRTVMAGAKDSLECVRTKLLAVLAASTVLVGHSIENDLRALKLLHRNCVDTSVLFRKLGNKEGVFDANRTLSLAGGNKLKLRFLAKVLLGTQIQRKTHCSLEDALATLRVLKAFVLDRQLCLEMCTNFEVLHKYILLAEQVNVDVDLTSKTTHRDLEGAKFFRSLLDCTVYNDNRNAVKKCVFLASGAPWECGSPNSFSEHRVATDLAVLQKFRERCKQKAFVVSGDRTAALTVAVVDRRKTPRDGSALRSVFHSLCKELKSGDTLIVGPAFPSTDGDSFAVVVQTS